MVEILKVTILPKKAATEAGAVEYPLYLLISQYHLPRFHPIKLVTVAILKVTILPTTVVTAARAVEYPLYLLISQYPLPQFHLIKLVMVEILTVKILSRRKTTAVLVAMAVGYPLNRLRSQ